VNIPTLQECLDRLPGLYEDWDKSMQKVKHKSQIRGFVVKIKFHDFTTTTKEMAARSWPQIEDFKRLLTEAWHRQAKPVRLLGLGVRLEDLPSVEDADQLSFF